MVTLLDEIFTDQEAEYEEGLEIDSETRLRARLAGRKHPAAAMVPPRAREQEFEQDEELNDFEIIGASDSRQRITQTKTIPFRWTCTIIPTFTHPTTGKEIEMVDQPGSGFVIGPAHIATAAHVLFPTDGPLKDQSPVRVRVTPGHDQSSEPYGHFVSSTYRVRSEWRSGGKNTHNPSYDFALIKVSSDLQKKGLKCWGEAGTNTFRYPIDKAWLKGKVINVGGYPRDKKLYTQWIAHDKLNDPEPTRGGTKIRNLFTHSVDTCLGQSGSPVWYWDGKDKRYLVGIHTGSCDFLDGCSAVSGSGCVAGSSRWSHNRGVLLTSEVDQQIKAWLT